MSKKSRDLDPSKTAEMSPSLLAFERRRRLGSYFRSRRLEICKTEAWVTEVLGLPTSETLVAYESGRLPMPLEEVYALTNLLNLAPEDVMDLIHGLYATLGTD